MTQIKTVIITTLLATLILAAPLPAVINPFKVVQAELRTSPLPSGEMPNFFQLAQHCQQGVRVALSVTDLGMEDSVETFGNGKWSWEVRQSSKKNKIILETTGGLQLSHLIVKVSIIIIGRQWEEKVIFLQKQKITPFSTIKHLENGLLLTTSSSNKFTSKMETIRHERQVFILYRGFQTIQDNSNAMMSLRGYYIGNQHIHIHTQMLNIATCQITLMIIDKSKLTEMKIQMVHVSITTMPSPNSLTLPSSQISFKNCFSTLRTEETQQCWVISPNQRLEFKSILNETQVQSIHFDYEDYHRQFQLEEYSHHGRKRLLSPCVPGTCRCDLRKYPNALTCYEDNNCKCMISSCGPGYYATASLVTSCTPCPTNLTHCTNCALQYGTTNVTCTACSAGYTVLNKVCVACPIGCATCTTTLINYIATVTCTSCLTTLTLQTSGSIKICGCAVNQFLNRTASPVVCVTCPVTCLTCTSLTVCTTCAVSSYPSNTTCLACMPICKTCTDGTSCTACYSTATLSMGGTCTCPSPLFFDINTKTCLSCTTLQPNCANCGYSGAISASSVICVTANAGFRVSSGSAVPCVSYCTDCNAYPTPACTTCNANFQPSGSGCVCNTTTPLYYSTTQNTCLICSAVISGCSTCNTNTIPNATTCQSCLPGYFSASYPSLTCTACPSICLTCTSATVCQSCVNNLVLSTNTCTCNAGFFVSPTTLTCQLCINAIFGCLTCNTNTTPVTCATANPGFYIGSGGYACYPCPATCSSCSSSTICTACDPGYVLTNGTCLCDTVCQSCLTLSSNACSFCTTTPYSCTNCSVGFYYDTGSSSCLNCSLLIPHCADCTNTTCNACAPTFTLGIGGCYCNNTAGLYLALDGLSCQGCSTVIPHCQACAVVNSTVTCVTAAPGYYVSNVTDCQPCTGNCLTCSGNSSYCLTCLITYVQGPPNQCNCDSANNYYYNQLTSGCSLCTTIIPSCQTCSTAGLVTTCLLCLRTTFWNATSLACEACSTSCTTCSSPTVCTGCPNNLVLSQVAGYATAGICVCDNRTATVTYFDSISGTCQPCSYFYTTCTSCYLNGSTVLCSTVSGSTYLVAGQIVNCPSPCSTCDASGCLSCPVGMDITNGSCVCGSACTSCESLAVGCVNCTISSGTITSCLQCLPGMYLSSPNCLSCPSTCVTCTSETVCQTCQPSYVLINNMCSCALSLGIFPNSAGVCTACSTIFYGCTECQVVSGSTACVVCQSGYFIQGGACKVCSFTCVTCSGTATTCTSCASGQTLTAAGACACTSPACLSCSALSPNCASCIYNIYGTFTQCGTCAPDYYLNAGSCTPCPTACQSCGAGGLCLTCPNTFENIGGNCVCNSAKGLWQSNGTCTSCSSLYSNCISCTQNTLLPLNVSCSACQTNYYLLASGTCTPSVCGDGLITSGQLCDDGNTVSGDGCSNYCQVEVNFRCTGQPSVCRININFYISPNSIITNKIICNRFDISFTMYPVYTSYDTANFFNMFSYASEGAITLKSASYSGGVVTYTFDYSANINNQIITLYFSPALLAVTETAKVPVIVVDVPMSPNNNVQLIYYQQTTCKNKQNVQQLAKAIEYASYGTLIASALPCKIVGLELFGVLQLAHINVGNMDYVNTMMTPLMSMKGVHGFTLNVGNEKKRMLQTSYTPSRVQSIGYESNFLRNCNVMLMIVIVVILVSIAMYLSTWICQKCAPCLHSISKRIIKEVLLTLILFNCFNFAYSAGLHFNYAPRDDSLYTAGTVAAILALVIPLLMTIGLMCAEDEGFGEYKEKFKEGLVNRLYFVVTILYRTGIGLYISTANQDAMSTLIVIALSIAFLLYNLVNLPYTKAYHNYRANICHFTQFICLFVAMYYRSMMSSTPTSDTAQIFSPVYLEMSAILISLIVSVLVLCYEIYLFVLDCIKGKDEQEKRRRISRVSDDSSLANEKQITEGNIESFTNEKKLSFDQDL